MIKFLFFGNTRRLGVIILPWKNTLIALIFCSADLNQVRVLIARQGVNQSGFLIWVKRVSLLRGMIIFC